jgi:hypothetical protein
MSHRQKILYGSITNWFWKVTGRRVPDYTTPDWVLSLHEGAGPRFGEKPLKRWKIWVWVPLFASSFEKVWISPRSYLVFSKQFWNVSSTKNSLWQYYQLVLESHCRLVYR